MVSLWCHPPIKTVQKAAFLRFYGGTVFRFDFEFGFDQKKKNRTK